MRGQAGHDGTHASLGTAHVTGPEAEALREELVERLVRRARGVDVAVQPQDRRVGLRDELAEQPRLADARVTDELHDAALPGARRGHRRQELPDLLLTPDQRELRDARRMFRLPSSADDGRLDQLRLALHRERRKGIGLELGAGSFQGQGAPDQLAGTGLRHQPRGQVDAVSGDGVDATEPGAVVAGEDPADVHARAHAQDLGGVEHLSSGGEDAGGVVTRADRGTGDEDDLAAVGIDVGGQERHPVGGCRFLAGVDDLTDRVGDGLDAGGSAQRVHPGELDEADGDVAMLVGDLGGQHVLRERGRKGDAQIELGRARAAPPASRRPMGHRRAARRDPAWGRASRSSPRAARRSPD